MTSNNTTTTTTRQKWPEERRGESKLCFNPTLEYKKWTYSYMNSLLQKGSTRQKQQSQSRQQPDNDTNDKESDSITKLHHDDLYRVPTSMESKLLAQKFE